MQMQESAFAVERPGFKKGFRN